MMGSKGYSGNNAVFALYRGDDFLCMGTAAELAKQRGVKPSTIAWMASPAWKRRCKNFERATVAVKVS